MSDTDDRAGHCKQCGQAIEAAGTRGPERRFCEPCRRLRSHLFEAERIIRSGAIRIAPGKPGVEFRRGLRRLVLGVANAVPPAEPWSERDGSGRFLPKVGKAFLVVALILLPASAASANSGPWSSPGWRGDCPDTREAVISIVCAGVEQAPGTCRIVAADCRDTYTGERSRRDGRAWQVDHGYPASVAWKRRTWRGADGKVCSRPTGCSSFAQFYNDERNLYVTTARANNRKNDRMPDAWCPALRGARMLMAKRIVETASKYKLRMTKSERSALALWRRGECAPGALLIGGE